MKQTLAQLHKAFDSRVRLGLMAALAANPQLDFNSLKEVLDVTDGNLASHLKGLEKEGFVQVEKSFVGRKPNTSYGITAAGRLAFAAHIQALEQLILSQKKP